ncbi:MAG TPA: hypothetical protein VGN23_13290 [Verrucomicrobiae bacterium]|jgi:hypothetical protein
MDDNHSSEDSQSRFKELVKSYQTKLPRKLALLLPFKAQIEGLLARKASYDDIRLLLEDVKIIVSKNTVYRFCHQVIGQKSIRRSHGSAKEIPQPKISPAKIQPVQPPTESIGAALREQRERFSGPWSRRKRGPRIADSKNL